MISLFSKKNVDDTLELVGDFDGLYKADKDPWSQSAEGAENLEMKKYYDFSRAQLLKLLKKINPNSNLLEVGCGLGFVMDFIAKNLAETSVSGLDISSEAIRRARENFPEYEFLKEDITKNRINLKKRFDVVILSQVLWYVLDDIETVMSNVHGLITDRGHFIITQAFPKKQLYGSDIIEGHEGLLGFMDQYQQDKFYPILNESHNSVDMVHIDGISLYQRL